LYGLDGADRLISTSGNDRAFGGAGADLIDLGAGDDRLFGGTEGDIFVFNSGYGTGNAIGDFEITVSAYPEKHPEAASLEADIDALQMKVDAGATRAITQFFFDNDLYFRFLDKVRARGITIPILPGIVPVQNFKQTANFARKTGASVPQWLADRFEGLDDDVATRRLVAAAVCAEQVLDLIDRGCTDLHFYTMNKADLVYAVCHLIGVRAGTPAPAVAVAAE
jgi:methylenetetrahydrofolate reductase (NADPH)